MTPSVASDVVMLRIVVSRGAKYHHHALSLDLVNRAQKAGLAGATMLEVIEGFGTSHRTRVSGRWAVSDAVAYQLLIVDTEDRVRRFIDEVRSELAGRGLVTEEPVTVLNGADRFTGPTQVADGRPRRGPDATSNA
jgi:PII-like signaling protein